MDIVILCEYDFSGNMYNLATAINRYTKHNALAIKDKINKRLCYPSMVLTTKKKIPRIREIIHQADAVIWKELPHLAHLYSVDLAKVQSKKNVVILGGGGYRLKKWREKNLEFYGQMKNVRWATSSLDFIQENPMWTWVPASIRVDDLREKYDYSKLDPPLLVASPSYYTDKVYHVGYHFNQIVKTLKNQKLRFQAKFIFDMTNHPCLIAKAPASIFFDRLLDIYGINSQEAGAFETAVVTGLSDFVRDTLAQRGYPCPFIVVKSPSEAAEKIKELLQNPDILNDKRRECYQYVQKLHSGKVAANNLIALLESIP